MKRPLFLEGGYYHIYNRGVDKRKIFLSPADYTKFIQLLIFGNDTKPIIYLSSGEITSRISERTRLVDVICYCLMSNHFHLLLRQKVKNGIPLFMQKISTGYAMYFNLKNERSGALFQGRYKGIHIERDEYLTHLSRYIHLNPAEMVEPGWKENGINDSQKIHDFVKNYKWSSYSSYLNRSYKNHILHDDLICKIFKDRNSYEDFVKGWINKDLCLISDCILE